MTLVLMNKNIQTVCPKPVTNTTVPAVHYGTQPKKIGRSFRSSKGEGLRYG